MNASAGLALLLARHWPEPNSTAAGRRTLDLIGALETAGYRVEIASPAETSPFQANTGHVQHSIAVNDSRFDDWIKPLNPALVIYDRFVMEEQFGWRVHQQCPTALTLLDTSDFHSLREARQQALTSGEPLNLFNATAERELAAMARCDLTLMISQVEIDLLQNQFHVPAEQLLYLPFLVDQLPDLNALPGFDDRQNLMMIGGFKHAPNRDAVAWFRTQIWPLVRARLPGVECHVYGAYADHAMQQQHQPKAGFYLRGRVEDALATMQQYRLNLAPLRFGAGQKGKILDGWLTGTPTVTTPIGAESMAAADAWVYPLSDDPQQLADTIVRLYTDPVAWQQTQRSGLDALKSGFWHQDYVPGFVRRLNQVALNLADHRNRQIWGRILRRTEHRAEEFMSRWIEAKNRTP
ncbi:glycosyltransferase [Saccharospirillum mangrovi]|uniref:glycosyltransferase n=1 Tax=Saccharospirillum mangrovi TaxID=2161747 RepID=UPI001E38462C|nr:glycosyltransferase [Saccharospirillum mangrovi]